MNDSEKTVVDSAVVKVDAGVNKCIVRVVYGGDSKFVIIFEVERIIEERPPVNSHYFFSALHSRCGVFYFLTATSTVMVMIYNYNVIKK